MDLKNVYIYIKLYTIDEKALTLESPQLHLSIFSCSKMYVYYFTFIFHSFLR